MKEFDWHHVSLVVDETELAQQLIRQSLERTIKSGEIGYDMFLDVQSFIRRSNDTTHIVKALSAAKRVARGELSPD